MQESRLSKPSFSSTLPTASSKQPCYQPYDLLGEELAVEAIIEDLRQPSLSREEKGKLSEEALVKLQTLCEAQKSYEASSQDEGRDRDKDEGRDEDRNRDDDQTKQLPSLFKAHNRTEQRIGSRISRLLASIFCLLGFSLGVIKLMTAEYAFAAAAATLNFDQGIVEGVNPLLRLILIHNGKAIFLSSAIGILLGGGGNNEGWARLKMGGLWAIAAAAIIHIMKGTLSVQMPG